MKMIRLKVTTTTVSSREIAKIYKDEIWKLHRVPQKFLSDRELLCIKIYKRSIQDIRNQEGTIYTISPTKRWPNGINQLGGQSILATLHKLSAK